MLRKITGYSYRKAGHVLVDEQLACGHPGHRGKLAVIRRRIAAGQCRRCPHCVPPPRGVACEAPDAPTALERGGIQGRQTGRQTHFTGGV